MELSVMGIHRKPGWETAEVVFTIKAMNLQATPY